MPSLASLLRTFAWIRLTLSLLASAATASAAVNEVPTFQLPRWKTGEIIRLSDFAGEIVVLDFFAYWCVPCRRASGEVEIGVKQYYARTKGNPQGVPVNVISVNIENDNPALTEQFIRQAGLEFVVNDLDATLLASFGGASTPFLVILDGSEATREAPKFNLIYKQEGFEGTRKLREIIDRVRAVKNVAPLNPIENTATLAKATGGPLSHEGDVAFDGMLASDVAITSSTLRYGQKVGGTEWKLSYTHNTYSLDYEPFTQFDFLGFSERIHEVYNGGQVFLRQALGDRFNLQASGGAYSGFTDYRSIWLANYYKQQFDFVPGYEKPEPQGFNAASALRWEYQPTTGFIEAGFLYANDQIARGYELDQGTGELRGGRQILHTYSPILKFENVLTRRIRTLNEFQLTVTSGRDPRYSYRGSVNLALGERWVWRVSGGYTQENPTLRARFAGSTLEFEVAPRWFINVSALYYHDTGEIENSLFISTAAPRVQTYQAGLGLRYVGGRSSFSVSASPVQADYGPVGLGSRPFTNLYRDRTWIQVQAAWAITF